MWFHTRRIPVPGWDEYSKGGFSCPPIGEIALRLGFKQGVLSTTDSLDHPACDAERFDAVGADIADMEGAPIAWMASLHNIPYYGLKVVTDIMDENLKPGEQLRENLSRASESLAEAAEKLLADRAVKMK